MKKNNIILDCWIVDDEPLALTILESYVNNTPFLKLTGKFSSAKSAMQEITTRQPDLIFLDIQMPNVSGMEFARIIDEKTKIIFTTAFKEYALEGYKVNAIDYLLKPISYTNFLVASKKALSRFESVQPREESAQIYQPKQDGIFVKSDYKIIHVFYDEILYIEGLKSYVKIYTLKESKSIITLMAMKELEDLLPANSFIRIHRSYIVAKNKIDSVIKNRVQIGTKEIPIGDTYKEAFLKIIGQ